jgi:hypothetical protein
MFPHRAPIKRHAPITERSFTVSQSHEPLSRFPNGDPMEKDTPFPEPMIYSFIHSYLSESPVKELSQETGRKHMVTVH